MMSLAMKVIGITILAVIAIYIALYVFYKYLLPLQPPLPDKGEKARLIRYMSCSLAMCGGHAPDIGGEKDICKSPEVIDIKLEEEGGKIIKSCNSVCEQLKSEHGQSDKFCGKDYAIPFTFKDNVKYIGNYSGCGPGDNKWQTDVSCMAGWGNYIPCACEKCRGSSSLITPGGGKPAGKLLVNNGGCDAVQGTPIYGAIWIPNTMVGSDELGKCVKGTGSYDSEADLFFKGNDALTWCNFEKDNSIYIWITDVDEIHDECLCLPWTSISIGCCSSLEFGSFLCNAYSHKCPQVMICDHNP